MLIKSLQNSPLYDHPVDRFEVIETHISWVLLTGRYAYKIKKPVNLGFLDFTTLSARRFFCEEEVRLNRRFAPDLYLGVIPISGTEDLPILNGPDEPIEYAVKMIQFPEDHRLDRLLEQGRLHPPHIDDLARRMVSLHQQADVSGPESPFGAPERVFQPIQETFDHLQKLITDGEDRRRVLDLSLWFRQERNRLEDSLKTRKRDGFIRECHGDAHLANMVLLNGRVVPFDCIEFNENLRWIDVMSDVAFTVMDLDDHDAPQLASRFLNLYLGITGDYNGLRVLRFYEVYRALVRAMVACLHEKSIKEQFRQYFALAERFMKIGEPEIRITHGPSGSGKTRGSLSFLVSDDIILLRTDVERKRMFGLRAEERSPDALKPELYSAETTRRVYEKLAELTRMAVDSGYSVIVDGTFLKREQRRLFKSLSEDLGVPFKILDFQAPETVLRERVGRRAEKRDDASEADLEVLENQMRTEEPLDEEELAMTLPT